MGGGEGTCLPCRRWMPPIAPPFAAAAAAAAAGAPCMNAARPAGPARPPHRVSASLPSGSTSCARNSSSKYLSDTRWCWWVCCGRDQAAQVAQVACSAAINGWVHASRLLGEGRSTAIIITAKYLRQRRRQDRPLGWAELLRKRLCSSAGVALEGLWGHCLLLRRGAPLPARRRRRRSAGAQRAA